MRTLTACTAAVVAAASLLAVPASAQSVDDIVAKHIDARGGYKNIKAIQSIKITRTVATPFSSVKVVVFKKRPALVRFEQTGAGQTTAVPRGINADTVWNTGPGGKIITLAEPFASESREVDADFDGLLVDWKEKGHTVALEGKEAMTGWEAYKLKVTTKSGFVRHIYIDTTTYLDRQHAGTIAMPPPPNAPPGAKPGQRKFTSTFSDWKEVNGVKFAFAVDEDRVDGPITQSFATFTEKIEANVPMEDAIFSPPAPAGGN